MKNNIKKYISLTAMLLCLLLLSACAAGEVMNDIEDHLKEELAMQEGHGEPAETEDPSSDEPTEEINDAASEEPSEEIADEATEEPGEEAAVISENTGEEETAVSAAVAADKESAADESASEEPSAEEPEQDSETETTAEEADGDLGTVVKSIITDRNSIGAFRKVQRINNETDITKVIVPSREKAHFMVPNRETSSFQRVTPRSFLLISYESAVL